MQVLTAAVQESLVCLVCYDTTSAPVIRGLVPPNLFDQHYRALVVSAYDYLDKYGAPPGEHTLDLVDQIVASGGDNKLIMGRIFESMQSVRDSLNRDYVLSEVTTFIRQQRLKVAVKDAAQMLADGRHPDEVDRVLAAAHELPVDNLDSGTLLTDWSRSLRFLDQSGESMPTGIRPIDDRGLGPRRGELLMIAGPPGCGKSWGLIHLGRMAMLNRLRVCHITLEMPEQQVLQRYIQSLYAVPKRREVYRRAQFEYDDRGRYASLDIVDVEPRLSLADANVRRTLRVRLDKLARRTPPLFVKEYPTDSLTVEELEGFLKYIENKDRFLPDLLLVDYPDLMNTPQTDHRLALGKIYKQLRGLAKRRNMAAVVVTPANRVAEGAAVIRLKHMAEDYSKAYTADNVWTLNQTDAEIEYGLMRLYVAKGRGDQDKFTVIMSQSLASGQFALDTAMFSSVYSSDVDRLSDDDAAEGAVEFDDDT